MKPRFYRRPQGMIWASQQVARAFIDNGDGVPPLEMVRLAQTLAHACARERRAPARPRADLHLGHPPEIQKMTKE